jgi:hypothetical protein
MLSVEADVLFDASYTTGGMSLTPAMLGLTRISRLEADTSSDGRVFWYDQTPQKLKAFQSAGSAAALAEVPNATGLSLTLTRVTAYGY